MADPKKPDRRAAREVARRVREAIRQCAQEPLPPTPEDVEQEVAKAILADRARVLRMHDAIRREYPRGSAVFIAKLLRIRVGEWERPR